MGGRELFELYWLRIPGVGARHLQLLEKLDPNAGVDRAFQSLRARLPPDLAEELDQFAPRTRWGRDAVAAARADLHWLRERHARIVRPPDYPALLKEIHDPPPLLFLQGDVQAFCAPQIAIVGSRRATAGGREIAAALAAELVARDVVVTSGLARGIDAAAHRGALRGGGVSVAVLGAGLGHIYPRENLRLADEIRERGCIVTEFPPGMTARPEHFPRRNRIISGLSLGVVVVEAAARSGSLITARHALEQGREVFAAPGSIFNPLTRGCHGLIRQGARLLEGVEDILEELPQLDTAVAPGAEDESPAVALAADEARVLAALGFDNVTADRLIEHTGMEPAELAVALAALELKGFVRMERGGYIRCPSGAKGASV